MTYKKPRTRKPNRHFEQMIVDERTHCCIHIALQRAYINSGLYKAIDFGCNDKLMDDVWILMDRLNIISTEDL